MRCYGSKVCKLIYKSESIISTCEKRSNRFIANCKSVIRKLDFGD